MKTNMKTYTCSESTSIHELAARLQSFLQYRNMQVLTNRNQDGSTVTVQARVRGGAARRFIGMDKAVTIRINRVGDQVNVDIGESSWGDKAAVMAVSMFVLWPLTVTSGVGIYQQNKLIEDLWQQIDGYLLFA